MAYRVLPEQQITNTRKALGVLMPFSSDSVFVPTYSSLEAYKVNLYNFFLTAKGERVFDPDFGSTILSHLFSQTDEQLEKSLQDTIVFEIDRYFPKIEVQSVSVETFSEDHVCQISIRFRLKDTELEDELVLDVER